MPHFPREKGKRSLADFARVLAIGVLCLVAVLFYNVLMSSGPLFWFLGAIAFGLGAHRFWKHRQNSVPLFGILSFLFLLIGLGFVVLAVSS